MNLYPGPIPPDTPRGRVPHVLHHAGRPAPNHQHALVAGRLGDLVPDEGRHVGPALRDADAARRADLVRGAGPARAPRGAVLGLVGVDVLVVGEAGGRRGRRRGRGGLFGVFRERRVGDDGGAGARGRVLDPGLLRVGIVGSGVWRGGGGVLGYVQVDGDFARCVEDGKEFGEPGEVGLKNHNALVFHKTLGAVERARQIGAYTHIDP